MSIKTTGAEFWKFYDDDKVWPDGSYHDDTRITVEGVVVEDYDREIIKEDSLVTIDGGYIVMEDDSSVDFETAFKKWRKSQTTSVIIVECPIEKLDAIKAAIKAAGGKVK